MGAGGSVEKDGAAPQGYPHTARQKILSHWQQRQLSSNIFAVARHDERADAFGTAASVPMVNGAHWVHTDDFAKWPYDPPLSDKGVQSASETGQRLNALAAASSCQIHVVISSPYWRCVQTAVEICRGLGQNTRLLIDRSLGEVYGPSVMGQTEPACPVRPLEYLSAYCKSRGVHIHQKVIGTWPQWPEKMDGARKRFTNRFLKYLHRSSITKRNFMLVTHADGVGACLSIMPSQLSHTVEKVQYGGMFSGTRQLKEKSKSGTPSAPTLARGRTQPQTDSLMSIMSCDELEGNIGNDMRIPTTIGPESENWLSCGGWLSSGAEQFGTATATSSAQAKATAKDESGDRLELPHVSDGWQVLTNGIDMRTKSRKKSAIGKVSQLSMTMKSLGQGTGFDCRHIEKLLGNLSENPLGNDHELAPSIQNSLDLLVETDTTTTLPTQVSRSTFLFGESDVGAMSDVGTEFISGKIQTVDELIPTMEIDEVFYEVSYRSKILAEALVNEGLSFKAFVQRLCDKARAANKKRGIGGELRACDDTHEVEQVLQGPKQAVLNLWEVIKKDNRHVIDESSVSERGVSMLGYSSWESGHVPIWALERAVSPKTPIRSRSKSSSQWTSSDAPGRSLSLLAPLASDAPRPADQEGGISLEARTSTLAGSLASSLRRSRRSSSDDKSKPEEDSKTAAFDLSGSSMMARRRNLALVVPTLQSSQVSGIEANERSAGYTGKQMPSDYVATQMVPPRPLGKPGLAMRRNLTLACQSTVGVEEDTPNDTYVKLAPLVSNSSTLMHRRRLSTQTLQTPQPIVLEVLYEVSYRSKILAEALVNEGLSFKAFVQRLCDKSRAANTRRGIRGELRACDDTHYVEQVLQGPKQFVLQLWEMIKKDKRHVIDESSVSEMCVSTLKYSSWESEHVPTGAPESSILLGYSAWLSGPVPVRALESSILAKPRCVAAVAEQASQPFAIEENCESTDGGDGDTQTLSSRSDDASSGDGDTQLPSFHGDKQMPSTQCPPDTLSAVR